MLFCRRQRYREPNTVPDMPTPTANGTTDSTVRCGVTLDARTAVEPRSNATVVSRTRSRASTISRSCDGLSFTSSSNSSNSNSWLPTSNVSPFNYMPQRILETCYSGRTDRSTTSKETRFIPTRIVKAFTQRIMVYLAGTTESTICRFVEGHLRHSGHIQWGVAYATQ